MGGVIYIGDRKVGKTHLALELANPDYHHVTVSSLTYQKVNKGAMTATNAEKSIYGRYFAVKVNLPVGQKTITTDWLDTPGEIWRRSWQSQNSDEWHNFVTNMQKTEGILLILSPYREILFPNHPDTIAFPTRQQWIRRFERWVKFFQENCSKIEHLLLCLNKADLFCNNLTEESKKLAYHPNYQLMTWQKKDQYVYHRYFAPLHPHIKELNRSIEGLSVRCFITSIDSRELLELPWIYLGSYLAE